jgi:uncharacterized protein with HEPN domain
MADRLGDIMVALERIERRVRTVGATTDAELDDDTISIVAWSLLVLGEAIKSLPAEMRSRHPGVDWHGFAGLRDRLAHQYFRIERDLLWSAISEDLPPLRAAIGAESKWLSEAAGEDDE